MNAMLKTYLGSALTVAIVAGVVWVFISARRTAGGPPRQQRKHQQVVAVFLLLMAAHQALRAFDDSQFKWLMLLSSVVILVGVLIMLYQFGALPRDKDAYANYVSNPNLCGRCDYDLTGNTTGVCPECGWNVPTEPPLTAGHGIADSVGWDCWWRKWEIESLADWKKTLLSVSIAGLVFSVAGIIMLFSTSMRPGGMLILLIGSAILINSVRVIQYGRRHRHTADNRDDLP